MGERRDLSRFLKEPLADMTGHVPTGAPSYMLILLEPLCETCQTLNERDW